MFKKSHPIEVFQSLSVWAKREHPIFKCLGGGMGADGKTRSSWRRSGGEMGEQGATPGEQADGGAEAGGKRRTRALQVSRGHPGPLAFCGRGQCARLRG